MGTPFKMKSSPAKLMKALVGKKKRRSIITDDDGNEYKQTEVLNRWGEVTKTTTKRRR